MRQFGEHKKKSPSIIIILVLAIILAAVGFAVLRFFKLEKEIIKGPKTVVQLITDSGLASDNGRVNVLLLGTGGQGHEGPDLTDIMILASIDKSGQDVALVSIPRDLWAPNISAKINSAYAFGQEKDGQGRKLAQDTVRSLFDLPVHYVVRIDFAGFTKAIDLVGGVDIDVEKSFTDSKYPVPGKEDETCGLEFETVLENGIKVTYFKDATGSAQLVTEDNDPFTCRYETLTFKKGLTHMNGQTALKFVRSRHGSNDEGSDFARSARQQKVILAFRQQVLSSETYLNPKTIIDLISTFGAAIDTDIQSDDVTHFLKLGQKIEPETIRRIVLEGGNQDSVLEFGDPPAYGGQSVLVPKNANWTDLAEYVQGEIFKLDTN